MLGGDEEIYVNELIPRIIKDAFGQIFFTSPDSKKMEILHTSESFRQEGVHIHYYLLGHLDFSRRSDSIVARREIIMDIYKKLSDHFLKMCYKDGTDDEVDDVKVYKLVL